MKIRKKATAGSLESSDVLVTVQPNNDGVKINIESDVKTQYGDKIKLVIKEIIKNFEVDNVYIKANDKGALDYAIRARTETAIKRAAK